MVFPPLKEGVKNDISRVLVPGLTRVRVGASGIVNGVALEERDTFEFPRALIAVTDTVYVLLLSNPVITSGAVAR
jgi:hypothetical protein